MQTPTRLLEAAERLFGGWRQAVAAAGLNYDRLTRRELWTKERVLAAVRRRARQRKAQRGGRVPRGLWKAAKRHFGSWRAAGEAAGVQSKMLLGRETWTREKIVQAIQDLAIRRRQEPARCPELLRQAALRQFVSWPAAVKAAGFTPRELRRLRWAREARGGRT